MKIIKRSQLAMLSITFMIMIAGYINYKYNPEREESLGQTVKVNSNEAYLYSSNTNVDVYKEISSITNKDDSMYKNKNNLSAFRSSRDNMFSELEENYEQVISRSVSSEEVKLYQEKLDNVIKKKHLIEIVEGIIKAKGIEEIVIMPTDDKYNIMVNLETKLTQAQASMIQKIIEDEFNVDATKIKIIQQ